MMFHFFTLFIHRYENGYRGIEWFFNERRNYLKADFKIMAKTWTNLKFRLVQAIERKNDIIIFQDMITQEKYALANYSGNVPNSVKNEEGTMGLLELYNEKYYFNGVRVFVEPNRMTNARDKVDTLMKETGMSYENVMTEYTLEVLAVMLEKNNHHRRN